MPLRVGYSLATLAPGFVGGTESYARGVLTGLAGMDPGAVAVRVIANPAAAATLQAGGNVEVVRTPGRFERGQLQRLGAMLRMRADARRLQARVAGGLDVMHYAVTVPLPRVTGIPTVLTLQDVQHREHPEWMSTPERLYRRLAYDAAAQHATRVVTATEHARREICRHLGIGVDRIDVIPHGIDHERFAPAPVASDAQALAGLPLPERFVFYPANLWPHKNHERLVDALARTTPDVALVLCGQGYGRLDALRERARALGVADRLTHLGHVPGAALPALYRRAAGMIFPSLFEGFGIPLIEAMACGCPVASSDRSAMPEVVAGAGLLFDPTSVEEIAAALDRLAAGDGRDAAVAAGLERAAGFTWARCAAAHLDAYRAAAGEA
ncbi:MAG: glycosyltransferase family 4 protein [Solirubrobacteraceae bacterium]